MSGKIIFFTALVIFIIVISGGAVWYYEIRDKPTPVPTSMQTTAPTSVQTTAPTSMQTTAPTSMQTTAPTSVQTTAPTSVQTTAPTKNIIEHFEQVPDLANLSAPDLANLSIDQLVKLTLKQLDSLLPNYKYKRECYLNGAYNAIFMKALNNKNIKNIIQNLSIYQLFKFIYSLPPQLIGFIPAKKLSSLYGNIDISKLSSSQIHEITKEQITNLQLNKNPAMVDWLLPYLNTTQISYMDNLTLARALSRNIGQITNNNLNLC